ncbi:hypothetical protein [Streptomyces tendae]|uniref:hypothetical protein n=1 Tax=Streptomyces tendae TaxID=1932 RepID=UPI00249303B8|nr:hypothetical protein [Streptomyces tendae]
MIRTLSGIVKETGRVHLVTANVAYFQCDKVTCSCRLPISDRAHASHGVWRKSTDWEIVPAGGAV